MTPRTLGFPRHHLERREVREFLPELFGFLAQFPLTRLVLEDGYGAGVGQAPADYVKANPLVTFASADECWAQELVVVLRCPPDAQLRTLKPGSVLLSMLHHPTRPGRVRLLEALGVVGVAMDQVVDDLGRRLVENLEAVARNGVRAGLEALAAQWPLFSAPSRGPLAVTVLGAGAVGAHAVRWAARYGDDELRSRLAATGVPGVEVTVLDVELAGDHVYLRDRLARTDLLVDATQRRDTSRPVVKNEWLALLPPHAVVVDLAVDPYDLDATPPSVKAIEGIPQGSLDQYVFTPGDPAWDAVDARVPHAQRRTVASCYSWPGIRPAACMHVYGKQLEPVLRALVEKGPRALRLEGGPWAERATARALHTRWLPDTPAAPPPGAPP